MELKILCPRWGHEHLSLDEFFAKVKTAGYDGIDTWMPEKKSERKRFISLLADHDLTMVSHQHQASGNNIDEFCKSFEYFLNVSMECNPILINSHSGRDFFTLEQQLQVIDVAENFSVKNNIRVVHETHRGRIGFGPMVIRELFGLRPKMKITADFSHWVCVTESYLEDYEEEVDEAIRRTEHIHARIGFIEGPQISDPRLAFWQKEVGFFLGLWDKIMVHHQSMGKDVFTITPEFGPPPYMWTNINDDLPVTNQWDVNLFMKDLLKKKFSGFCQKGQKNSNVK